ncbi:hypothetical protein MD588_23405 [Photobacterium sp. SDRW27]|uniref:hypothetical protein n=1 Tax=Photobacterium obscurum TaxID=2829490 RepID=UPI00224353C4|nr:hypothetical protein [Photobacterium obscurum]MCW8331752.1 hypothetical protein [Photobacterium obscurum]
MKGDKLFEKINSSALVGALILFSGMAFNSLRYHEGTDFFLFSLILALVLMFVVKDMTNKSGTRTFREILIMCLGSIIIGVAFEMVEIVGICSLILVMLFPFHKK